MKFLYAIPFASFLILGCSSGTPLYYTGTGVQCASGYDPIVTDMGATPGYNKVTVNQLPTNGAYTATGSDVFFIDTATTAQIEINNVVDANNNSNPTRACDKNIYKAAIATDSIPTIREITTDGSGQFTTENLGYNWATNSLTPLVEKKTVHTTGSIMDIYNGGRFETMQIYCVGTCLPTDDIKTFQVRASGTRKSDRPPFNVVLVEVLSAFTWKSPNQIQKEQDAKNK
jgi:hypothetical protein